MSTITITQHRSAGYPPSYSKNRRGFALLITITLLALLVLLLVSLASLTRVETSVAANNQKLAQARQNALMALNIAVGQLQRYAGPDNRVTAQASLTGSSVQNPWFTGVWDADTNSASASTWLVSGNETSALSVNETTNLSRTASAPDVALTSAASPGRVRLVGPGTGRMSTLPASNIEHAGVVVPAVAIETVPPGFPAGTQVTTGRYAWWVGDQGVKASLGLPDRADEVTYAPWSTVEQGRRIRQQIGSSPSYFRDGTAVSGLSTVRLEGFDPFDNTGFARVVTAPQLQLLTSAGGTVAQADYVKDRYHDFTTAAYSVLANTLPSSNANRGLMRDLSTKPDMLGTAYAKYANYPAYMETPGTTTAGAPAVPATHLIADANSARRRYITQPFASNAAGAGLPEIGFSVAPVLSNFVVQFQVRRVSATDPSLQIRSRVYVTMWNPYSTALVPPSDLKLEITGLPSIQVTDATLYLAGTAGTPATVDLQATSPVLSGGAIVLDVPFSKADRASGSSAFGSDAELATWLPGRVYSWTTVSGGSAGAKLAFYSNSIGVTGWTHLTGSIAPPARAATAPTGSENSLHVELPDVDGTPLTVAVKLGANTVATYTAKYDADAVSNSNISTTSTADYWCFAYTFRINQPRDYEYDRSWLIKNDPRAAIVTQPNPDDMSVLIPFNTRTATTPFPSRYIGTLITTDSTGGSNVNGNLIHRVQGQNARAMSTYNDVSLFELPRLPLLSLGELQHLQIKDKRPFSIGNSWGGTANTVFDRFFLSGLPAGGAGILPNFAAGQPMPNWNLKPVGVTAAAAMLTGNVEETSRHLLQGGGFNINSTSVPAWRAVLSSVRFSTAVPFVVADILNDKTANNSSLANSDSEAGTQKSGAKWNQTFNADPSTGTHSSPVFFRLPQSAQEIYYWQDPTPASGISGNARKFYTSAFRLGVHGYNNVANQPSSASYPFTGGPGSFTAVSGAKVGTARQHVTADQIEVLASAIVSRLRTRAASGPFRSLETFLSETSVFGGRSLLEDAIEAAGMNAAEVKPLETAIAADHSGLSTLTLTQADLLSATAPYLRTRSDTFTVRTYGEVINPLSTQVEGKAWVEATVQRFPETASSTDSALQPGTGGNLFGRRFKIISFRWLTPNDI